MSHTPIDTSIARPGEASPAEQLHAAQLLSDVERDLDRQIAALPAEYQSAARMQLQGEMSRARGELAGGGPQSMLIAQRLAERVASAVEGTVLRAHGDAAVHAMLTLDRSFELSTAQRMQIRMDIMRGLMDDPIFRELSEANRARLVESAAAFVESVPEVAGQAAFQQEPENRRDVERMRERGRGDRRAMEAVLERPEMAPFRERMLAAQGQLMGMQPRGLSRLRQQYENGEITAEEFTTRTEALASREGRRMERFKVRNLEGLHRESPDVAAAFDRYLEEQGISVGQYSSHPPLDRQAVLAAYRRLDTAGGDFSRLSDAEQQLIARHRFETRMEAANDIREISQALTEERSAGLQQEMQGMTPEQRADLMVERGLINHWLRDEAVAFFANNEDEVIFSRNRDAHRGAVYTKTLGALGDDYALQKLQRSVARGQLNDSLREVVDSIAEQGWGQNVSMDFMVMDTNSDGWLELKEFQSMLKKHDVRLSSLDTDSNGTIDRAELVAGFTPLVQRDIENGRG